MIPAPPPSGSDEATSTSGAADDRGGTVMAAVSAGSGDDASPDISIAGAAGPSTAFPSTNAAALLVDSDGSATAATAARLGEFDSASFRPDRCCRPPTADDDNSSEEGVVEDDSDCVHRGGAADCPSRSCRLEEVSGAGIGGDLDLKRRPVAVADRDDDAARSFPCSIRELTGGDATLAPVDPKRDVPASSSSSSASATTSARLLVLALDADEEDDAPGSALDRILDEISLRRRPGARLKITRWSTRSPIGADYCGPT